MTPPSAHPRPQHRAPRGRVSTPQVKLSPCCRLAKQQVQRACVRWVLVYRQQWAVVTRRVCWYILYIYPVQWDSSTVIICLYSCSAGP